MPRLSKTQYCNAKTCVKWLWLYHHKLDERQAPGAFAQYIMELGSQVGVIARELFPSGELIGQGKHESDQAIEHTQRAIANGAHTLYEPAFCFDGVLVRVDILNRDSQGRWNLYEVKSSTRLKSEHVADVAIQKYVVENSGLDLHSCNLIRLNKEFVREDEQIDLHQLFVIQNMDEQIERESALIEKNLSHFHAIAESASEPTVALNSACRSCDFKKYCFRDLPEDNLFTLSRLSEKNRLKLEELGVKRLSEIPATIELTPSQRTQVNASKSGKPIIQVDPIQQHLETLQYPRYFFDFETVSYAVPNHPFTRPYQALPAQYSVHIQTEPGAEFIHKEFLHTKSGDPRPTLIEQMLQDLGEKGSIIVYFEPFESGRIQEMSRSFPQYEKPLQALADRIWDLALPFGKRWYYHPKFNGSFSIKTVLPTLVPDLSYASLDIQDGGTATMEYVRMLNVQEEQEKQRIQKALLKYCELDTWAMVKILEVLEQQLPKGS